jgi:small subunit ribosomal protein S25e
MGGAGKKSVSAEAKRQLKEQGAEKEKEKEKGKKEEKTKGSISIDKRQVVGMLPTLKAITPQSVARSTGVRVSIANSLLKELEHEGIIKRFGGYNGHYVYRMVN